MDPEPITWSRNFDEEEVFEEDVASIPSVTFQWSEAGKAQVVDGKLKTKKLFVAHRVAASVLLHASFDSKTLLGELKIEGFQSSIVQLRQASINHKTFKIYSINSLAIENGVYEALVLICQVQMPIEAAARFAKVLFQNIDANETVLFDTIQESTYLAGKRYEVPCLRKICSESKREETQEELPNILFLEAPVLLDGFTASVLQYGQLHNLKSIAYISLESDLYLENPTIIAWEPLLKRLIPAGKISSSTSYSALLKQVVTHRPNPLFS